MTSIIVIRSEHVKETLPQTSWWHIKTNQKPFKLENDYTIAITTKVSNKPVTFFQKCLQYFWFQKRQKIICLFCLAIKGLQLRNKTIQRGLASIISQRMTNQTIKRRFLLSNYTGLVICKRWWSNDVYKEIYWQKVINTTLLQ